MHFLHRTRPRQRGVVLVWLAIFITVLLGVVSLGIDAAKVMAARTQLQNAADAAALAGASAVDPATGVIDPAIAVSRAQEICVENKAFVDESVPVVLAAGDVEVIDGDKVHVTVRREGAESVVTHIARVLGIDALQVRADATAKVDSAGAISCGITPVAAIPDSSGVFQIGCENTYTLKLPGGEGNNGNYNAVQFPSCQDGPCAGMGPNGANTYRCLLRYGYCCNVSLDQVLNTEPGNMSGPTTSAITTRFNADTDQRTDICHSAYTGNGKRIVFVPVTTAPTSGGMSQVTVTGFAAFFLKNIPGPGNQNALIGEFINATAPGTGGGDGTSTGPVVFTIRLIE